MIMKNILAVYFACLSVAIAGCQKPLGKSEPWPAEPWISAITLTHLDTAFKKNMSGACYNPETGIFWVCCNGGPSTFWGLKKIPNGSLEIVAKGQKRAKYDLSKGDLEGICQANYREDLLYLMVERIDMIREYDVSSYGNAILKNEWDISAYVPTMGWWGSEGITFVPDEWLKRGGFTDADGNPYVSKNGMGGLMFVAHQNGGRIYVFDLSRETKAVHFVGSYKTSRSESSGLEFDRSSGLLYIWHNIYQNYLEVTRLSSYTDVNERRMSSVTEFIGPKGGNLEGIAISPAIAKDGLCLIVDDDNQDGAALMLFRKFDPAKTLQKVLAEQFPEVKDRGTLEGSCQAIKGTDLF
jgi:hypothetical protein